MQRLKGRIAVVTGASRGAGRGVALALGQEGATVYVTGRSTRGQPSVQHLPGTVEDTAALVSEQGGLGIPVRCDHTVDADVEALFERVGAEQGGLDILVNSVFGLGDTGWRSGPFWEQSMDQWHIMFDAGVRAHLLASRLAVPLMLPRGRGLIASISLVPGDDFGDNIFYPWAMGTINTMIRGMAQDLRPHNIAAVALSPGWMRTEGVLHEFKTDEQHWQEVPGLKSTESTQYVGRAVVALAADPDVPRHSGQVRYVADLAQEYGFTDYDGRSIPRFVPEG